MIGTGHPVTYCYGQTDEFGKVAVGTRFTKEQCDEKLAESLPKYLEQIGPYVHEPVPVKVMASLLDASYNAGAGAVRKSPMVANINSGNIRLGCEAFKGWYIRSDGQVRKGLVARRSGIDSRKSEEQLCLEGLKEQPNKADWYLYTGPVKVAAPKAAAPQTAPKEAPRVASRPMQAKEGPPCYGVLVDDQTYTSHPECRIPLKPKPTIVHKRHHLKPHVVTCTGFLWTRECK
jgi:lysozyme